MGKIVGRLTGATQAAKRQAAATRDATAKAVQSDLMAAQQAQASRETAIAQQSATAAAADLLAQPVDQVDVNLAPQLDAEIDTTTGRRKTPRSAFMSRSSSGSGISI